MCKTGRSFASGYSVLKKNSGDVWVNHSAGPNSKHRFTTSFLWRKVPESDDGSVVQALSVHATRNHRAATARPVRGGPRDVGVFLPAI